MIWHIHEGFNIKECGIDLLALQRKDQETIIFHIDEVDDIINALKRVKSRFSAEEDQEAEIEAFVRWGKTKTPTLDKRG